MRILYVEDTDVNVRAMQRIVKHAGYELMVAADASEGMQMAEQAPDLILIDLNLPDVDGLTLVRQLRERNLKLPIVAVTAHAMTGDRERCIAAGCDNYVTKPFLFDQMIALLRQYVPI